MAATPPHPPMPKKGMAPRPPRIIINTPAYGIPNRLSQMPYTATTMPPFTANAMPLFTAGTVPPFTAATNATLPNSVGAPMWPPYATSYFTKGFEGFRDFAKTGLSSGEKIAYWIYEKFSKLSKKWFTHFFLFTVVLLYSAVGALMFQAIEGPSEKRQMENIRGQRNELLQKLRLLSLDNEMLRDPDGWEGRALAYIREYKHVLVDSFRDEAPKMKWSFWNTMFYCGTIYTTIAILHGRGASARVKCLEEQRLNVYNLMQDYGCFGECGQQNLFKELQLFNIRGKRLYKYSYGHHHNTVINNKVDVFELTGAEDNVPTPTCDRPGRSSDSIATAIRNDHIATQGGGGAIIEANRPFILPFPKMDYVLLLRTAY